MENCWWVRCQVNVSGQVKGFYRFYDVSAIAVLNHW